MKRWICGLLMAGLVVVAACGDDDEGETGNSGDFVKNCTAYCEGLVDAGCENTPPINKGQCGQVCAIQVDQLQGCLAEWGDAYGCAADGGFECVNGDAVPKAACIGELTAQIECMDGIACRSFCAEAQGLGCGGGSEEACINECEAELTTLDESGCDWEYEDLLECWGGGGLECNGSEPAAGSCVEETLDVGDCMAFDDVCAGYCWAADVMGCGEGCTDTCATEAAATCGYEYQDLLECRLRYGDASCGANGLTSSSCDYEEDQYTTCLNGM